MIYLGLEEAEKVQVIREAQVEYNVRNTVVISPKQRPLELDGCDNVEWAETIMYRTFYRLLQEVQDDTLIVLSEPLRTQNRYELTYNCIRNFLNQTGRQLVFQHLPQIDERDDFMILLDFVTRSRWKRNKWDINLILDNAEVHVKPVPLAFRPIPVPTAVSTQRKYQKERDKLFANIGHRDPHTIPRNLYLIGGKDKRDYIDGRQLPLFGEQVDGRYVARNQRLSRECVDSYADATAGEPYTVVEFPHRFIDFSDFLWATRQQVFDVLVADLKADRWYLQRYQEWKERLNETYASLQQ